MKSKWMVGLLLTGLGASAVAFADKDEPTPAPTPAETDSPFQTLINFGRHVMPANYKVVALPVRPLPRPAQPASTAGQSTEDWQRIQREIHALDDGYAKVLDAFFSDMARHGWHFVSFIDGESIALFEQRLAALN